MRIVVEIPNKDIPKHQEVIGVHLDFIDGHIVNAGGYGFEELPKGHGRLIDADKFEKRLMDARSYYIGEKADDFDLRFAAGLKSAAERLVDAPTIIEADTESEGKE